MIFLLFVITSSYVYFRCSSYLLDILGKSSSKFPSIYWTLPFNDFEKMIANKTASASGPDGIPYSAWNASPSWSSKILYDCYCEWISTGFLPKDFNESFLLLLPKGDEQIGRRQAKDTRPLSGANSDAKLLAYAFAAVVNPHLDQWAAQQQREFIKGRNMIKNVIDIETHAIAKTHAISTPAIFLFDFAPAFPSLARRFIWMALQAI